MQPSWSDEEVGVFAGECSGNGMFKNEKKLGNLGILILNPRNA